MMLGTPYSFETEPNAKRPLTERLMLCRLRSSGFSPIPVFVLPSVPFPLSAGLDDTHEEHREHT
jgi:hypothetical protein